MKNIIKINVNNPYYFDIENIDNGTNSIYVKFLNFTDTGKCEVYYGDAYYREIELDASGAAEIPAECYSDGANMHLRYENGTITGFIHITGDGSKYENMALVAVSNCIAAITGSENKVITDYGAALAEIISGHTPADNKSCYNDLNVYRKLLISSINSMGGSVGDNATVEDITYSLMELDAPLDETWRVLIAEAITNKGVDTSPTDTAEVMAANIDSIKAVSLRPYIKGNATGYFDTGLLFGDLTRVEIDFIYMTTVRDGSSIFAVGENGTYLGSDNRYNGYIGIYYGSGASSKSVKVDAIESDIRFNRVVFDNVSKTITINGNNVTSISVRSYSPTIPIFAIHDEVFRAFPTSGDAKLYAFRIYDNDVLLRDYVPAKDADGIVCLRDRISGAYLYDATGTNTFGYGEEYVIYKGEL